tara:strand:+ start:7997 stop:8899 length:903 start_codon:yes stop_codon:yes gene_type:complete
MSTHIVTVKGMDADHNVLATDSITFELETGPQPPEIVYGTGPECHRLSYEGTHVNFTNGKWEGKTLQERTIGQSLMNNNLYGSWPGATGTGCDPLMTARNTRSTGITMYDTGGNLSISASTLVSKLNAKIKYHHSHHGIQTAKAHDHSYYDIRTLSWSNAVITDGKLTSIQLTGFDSAGIVPQDWTNGQYIANRYFWVMLGSNGEVYNASLRPGLRAANTVAGPLLSYRGGMYDPYTITGFYDYAWAAYPSPITSIYYHLDEFFDVFRTQNSLESSVTFDLLLAYAKSPIEYVPVYDDDD